MQDYVQHPVDKHEPITNFTQTIIRPLSKCKTIGTQIPTDKIDLHRYNLFILFKSVFIFIICVNLCADLIFGLCSVRVKLLNF